MFLDTIAGHVREEVGRRRGQIPPSALQDRPLFHSPCRGFEKSLQGSSRRIIAEIKRASPSQGLIREHFDPIAIAGEFAANGASALSVLTEEHFFRGSLAYLEQVRGAVALPLLRKDFVLDDYQVLEAKSYGADAILLIAALLEPVQLRDLREQATSLSLDTLVEVHSEEELDGALKGGASLIGINNRDLRTFKVSLETTERLLPLVPSGKTVVCESGIDSRAQIEKIERLGIHVFLIGETLMRTPKPGVKLKELLA